LDECPSSWIQIRAVTDALSFSTVAGNESSDARIQTIAAVIGTVAAIVLGFRHSLDWFIIICCGVLVLLAWRYSPPSIKNWRHWHKILPWLAAALASVIAALGVVETGRSPAEPAITTSGLTQAYEVPTSPITISQPQQPLGECVSLNGTGIVPAGEDLVIENQQEGNPDRFFIKAGSPPGNQWSARIDIGGKHLKGKKEFTISAILMTGWLADYLSTTQQNISHSFTFWASSQWPPSYLIAQTISVTRSIPTGPGYC
jgi:hypothetical protein